MKRAGVTIRKTGAVQYDGRVDQPSTGVYYTVNCMRSCGRYAKDKIRVSEISRDEVAHLAKLSRLALSEDELTQFASQIEEIVDAVSAVGKVDAAGVEPMSHPHSVNATMRDDVVVPTLTAEQALDQAPAVEENRFVVPQILGGEE